MPPYGPICTEFYNADKPRPHDAEIAWYAGRLPTDAGPVLEAMCGSGRLLLPLAQRGLHVHGADVSAAMLASCEMRLVRAGLTPTLFRQDIATLNLPFRYGAALIVASSFQLISDPLSAIAALERIRVHLTPPAVLLMDLSIPEAALHPPAAALVEVRTVQPSPDERITLHSVTRVNAHAQRLDIALRYEKRAPQRRVEREDERLLLAWYDEAQIRTLLEEAGFDDIAIEPCEWRIGDGRSFCVGARAAR